LYVVSRPARMTKPYGLYRKASGKSDAQDMNLCEQKTTNKKISHDLFNNFLFKVNFFTVIGYSTC